MNCWFETACVVAMAVLGGVLGVTLRRLRGPYWLLGYACSLSLIAILALGQRSSVLQFIAPFSWITAGRARFALLAPAVTMGLFTLLARLPRRWERAAVGLSMAAFLTRFSILPFFAPVIMDRALANLTTTMDANGVCLQSTSYTCGPAAAVTALRKLGLSGGEGEIAMLSHTSPWVGTLPACLCEALHRRYGPDGIRCEYRRFDSVSDLGKSGITLAVIKDTLLWDHCVVVLGVSDKTVTLADPVAGERSMPYDRFEALWRFAGIVLTRDDAPATQRDM